jgi:CheY-like chemotaxis protein
MKVFILDDEPIRIEVITRYIRKNGVPETIIVSASNATEAKDKLKEGQPWDELYLDHDLGGLIYVDSLEENTGYQVAKFIVDTNIKYEKVIIHSLNYDGAKRMQQVLKINAHTIPVTMFM